MPHFFLFPSGADSAKQLPVKRVHPAAPQRLAIFLTLLLTNAAGLRAAPSHNPAPLPAQFDVPAIDAYLQSQVRLRHRVGLSVTLVRNGQVALSKGYGHRSLESALPVETSTLFAIGSVSKQFTCAVVLVLADEGRLSVHDKVAKYYPTLTRATDISILDLMNHVSGYPDYYPLDFVDRRMKKPIEPDQLLRQYAGGRLDFEPGTRWSYSNTGYILLARIAEKVSGQSFGELLTSRILRPLGMHQTTYEPAATDPRLARGYTTFALSKPEPVAPEAVGWLGGAGGIYSTPSDLARWDLALAERRILSPAAWTIMTTARVLPDGHTQQYACGIGSRIQSGRQVLTHSGAVSGFNTYNAVVPSTRSAVAITCNVDGGLGDLPGKLLDLLLKETNSVPAIRGPSAVEVSKSMFAALQRGKVDRQQLGAEFSLYLSDEKLAAASKRLHPYGKPTKAELLGASERGGMEVSRVKLSFPSGTLTTLMYRQTDGTVEQFFVESD